MSAPLSPWRFATRAHLTRRAALIEDADDLLRAGESPEAVATRLGMTTGALSRRFRRAERLDLARLFDSAYRSQRRQTVVEP